MKMRIFTCPTIFEFGFMLNHEQNLDKQTRAVYTADTVFSNPSPTRRKTVRGSRRFCSGCNLQFGVAEQGLGKGVVIFQGNEWHLRCLLVKANKAMHDLVLWDRLSQKLKTFLETMKASSRKDLRDAIIHLFENLPKRLTCEVKKTVLFLFDILADVMGTTRGVPAEIVELKRQDVAAKATTAAANAA